MPKGRHRRAHLGNDDATAVGQPAPASHSRLRTIPAEHHRQAELAAVFLKLAEDVAAGRSREKQ
jgi:hypothetical protein